MGCMVKDAEGKKRTGSKPKRRELKGRAKQGLNQVMQFRRSSSVRFSFMASGELFPLVTSASNLLLFYFPNFLSMLPAQLGKASAIHEQSPLSCFSLWALLRFAIVGLITLNKSPLLELSP